MGLIDELRGNRVYIDTNIFIYLLEGAGELEARLEEFRDGLERGEFEGCASDLVLTEVLPPMVKKGDETLVRAAIALLDDGAGLTMIPCGREVFIQAGYLRGKQGMKTPDALHVALALEGGCGVFLTNDRGIRCPGAIRRVLFAESRSGGS